MIQLYKKDNNNFSLNGDLVIQTISNKGKFVTNDEMTYEFTHSYDDEGRWKEIEIDDVIAVPTPWSDKQLYRIYNIVKDVDNMTIYTRHIMFDLNNYVLMDKRPTNMTCKQALNYILKDTPFTGESNIVSTNTSYFVRKNIIEAINGDDENSIINRWGGEILPDNFIINIKDQIGGDYGVNVTLGKNLKSIEESIDMDSVVTRIIPEGYDGILLDGETPWVDSPLINNYSQIRAKVIKFDDIKVKGNESDEEGYDTLAQAQAAMIERCNTLYEGGLDKPAVNYKVEMYLLRDTEEYKDFSILEDVSIGDTVHCKHEGIGIECDARCISLEWHIENGDKIVYDTIELGTPEQNFFESTNDISNKVSGIMDKKGNVIADYVKGIIDATKASIRASRQIAETQSYRVGLCEDLDPNSPTYGATMWGTEGLFIADERKADGKDWNWTTAITGKGVNAENLIGDYIMSRNGRTKLDLNTGNWTVNIGDSDTNQIVMNQYGLQRLSSGGLYLGYVYGMGSVSEIVLNHGESWTTTLSGAQSVNNSHFFPSIIEVSCTALSHYKISQTNNADGTATFTCTCEGHYDGMDYTGWIKFRLISYSRDMPD